MFLLLSFYGVPPLLEGTHRDDSAAAWKFFESEDSRIVLELVE